ncbi:MAG: MFS transporter [Alphaproteobacteria bacterium]|nr:MFS transporter [Alphaproteobacteria bacterium]
MVPNATRIPPLQLFAYVLPGAPLAALGLPIVVHLPQFYASAEIGLSLAVTGLVFSLCRIADVFIDPTMGYVSDRLATRWGRRRPMVVAGTPVLLFGIWMVFVPGGPVAPLYLGFWLFVMYVGWSMVTIPLLSWGAELSPDYHERSRIYGWNQVSIIAGMVGVLVVPAVLENLGYPRALQILAMAVFAIVLLLPAVALCAGALPEPEVRLRSHAALAPTLRFLARNRAFRRVIAVDLVASTSAGAVGAMFFFFARFALGLPHWAGTLLLTYFVSGCLFIPFWIALSRRIGKHRALMASFAFTVATMPLYLLIPRGDLFAALPVFVLSGMNYGAPQFLLRSMMADIADADTAENGAERAGLMYSFLALTEKFGFGWSVGIAFVLLAWLGFDPKTANPPEAIAHMRAFYIALPCVLCFVNFFILRGYPLDEARQRALRLEVERRRAAPPPAKAEICTTGIAKGTLS